MTCICSYLSDMKVTLDTNILPADDLIASVLPGLFEFSIVSVTDRETKGTKYAATRANISNIPETLVLGESCLDQAVLGDCLSLFQDKRQFHINPVFAYLVTLNDDTLFLNPGALDIVKGLASPLDTAAHGILETLG